MALSVLHVHDLRETQLLKIATFALDELDGVESGKELLQNSHMASVDGGKGAKKSRCAQALDLLCVFVFCNREKIDC